MSRVQIEISLGILLILATSMIILVYGLNENDRMTAFARSQEAEAIELGAGLFELQCSRCHGVDGTGITGLCPPLNDRYFFDQRLQDVGWTGTLEDYIVATASSGRLVSTRPDQYPGQGMPAMPSFSEHYGGPLREDQIRSIARYIINWSETAQAVQPPPTPAGPVVGTDIEQELPEGDPASGEQVALVQGCVACHLAAQIDMYPYWLATDEEPAISERAATRITDPGYTGTADTPEQYLFESIVRPEVFLVPGYQDLMPHTFGNTLSDQEIADLIAYLLTLE